MYSVEAVMPSSTASEGTKGALMRDILCPMPSTVTRVNVKNGDQVRKGDVLLVVEAMKMEVGIGGKGET